MKRSSHFDSQAEAAATYGMSERHMGTILRSANVNRGDKGISKAAVAKAVQAYKASTIKGDGSLRDEKTKREIEKLDIEIGKMRDQLKPMDEWVLEVQELVSIVKVGLEQWVQRIAAENKSPDIYTWAQDCRDDVLRRLSEKVKDAEESNGQSMAGGEPSTT